MGIITISAPSSPATTAVWEENGSRKETPSIFRYFQLCPVLMWLQTLAPQSFGNHSLLLHCVRLYSIFTFKPITTLSLQFIDNIKQTKRLTCCLAHRKTIFPGYKCIPSFWSKIWQEQDGSRSTGIKKLTSSTAGTEHQLEPALSLTKSTDRSPKPLPSREDGQQHCHWPPAVPAGPAYRAAHRKESRTSTVFPTTSICIKEWTS